jgi:hypothetical protein
MVFGFGKPPAPAPVANGNKKKFNQAQLNTATANLQTALNKIANQHVLKYANAIRVNAQAQANAARATAVATQTPTPNNINTAVEANKQAGLAHQKMIQAEKAAETVVNTLPTSELVTPAVQHAEATAVNNVSKLIENIAKYNTREKLNKVKNNQRYKNAPTNANRARINQVVNNKRLELITPIV